MAIVEPFDEFAIPVPTPATRGAGNDNLDPAPSGGAPWESYLQLGARARAVGVAREVARRATCPAILMRAIEIAPAQSAYPDTIAWRDHGLAQGYSGIALTCAALDASFPEEGWDVVGHDFLGRAARSAEELRGRGGGLSTGLAGVAFAAWQLSRSGVRYRRLVRELDVAILDEARALARRVAAPDGDIGVGQFDVISGLAGIGAYLLLREEDEHRRVLDLCLSALVRMIHGYPDRPVPRWRTPNHRLHEEIRDRYPDGNLNCGLAHGIPGPLALLSLAYRRGVRVHGQADAIYQVVQWLDEHRVDDPWGPNWPVMSPVGDAAGSVGTSRAAWCYGSPGVARSILLASQAIGDTKAHYLAVSALDAVFRRPVAMRRIPSPTFCHGVAGLLQITLRFSHDTGLRLFRDAVTSLVEELLALYEPDSVLGFRSREARIAAIDQPGLLTGAPGVVMALLAAATPVEPRWDRLFLLS